MRDKLTRSDKLRIMIAKLAMSQSEFAQLIGVSDRTLKRHLSGSCSKLVYYASKYRYNEVMNGDTDY